ncbi:MAG: hypothetical protein NT117_02660 [Gammaproteobacteria bacterium]|nr:hypothetical protein [Gammaproteobacteria bacterium]
MNQANRVVATNLLVVAMAAAFSALPASPTQAHESPSHEVFQAQQIDELGRLAFPTSTKSAQAQSAFVEGMLLLHLFEYQHAQLAFRKAQALDPDFALAYWGEAMTATHPVWNQQNMAAGRAALAKLGATAQARADKAPTAREKAWLETAEILYGEGTKRERDARFAQALEKISRDYPQDDEAKLFHSLGLLGLAQGERDLPNFLAAAEIAKAVYRRNPEHPGAAHYWIHGMDDPEHASGALEAARSLSKIAPRAGHAQHMTAHIFMALGMWEDVVASNVTAISTVDKQRQARGQLAFTCGHYVEWLQYGYFQQGHEDKALKLLADCERTGPEAVAWFRGHPSGALGPTDTPDILQDRIASSIVLMRGMAIVDSDAYRKQAAATPRGPTQKGREGGWELFAQGFAEATTGNAAGAEKTLVQLRALMAGAPDSDESASTSKYLHVMEGMLDGAIKQAGGDIDGALASVAEAAKTYDAMPFDFGPPATFKPPHELAGEMLLAAGRPAEAVMEFDQALKWAPKRARSVQGRDAALAAGSAPKAGN